MMPVLLQSTEMSHTLTVSCAQGVDCWPPGLGEAVPGRCNPVLLAQPAPGPREGLGRASGGEAGLLPGPDTWLPPSASLPLSGLAFTGSGSNKVSAHSVFESNVLGPSKASGKAIEPSRLQCPHHRDVVRPEGACEGEGHLCTIKCCPSGRHRVGGGPLTWVTALVKPVISREACKACPRLSASSFTRARCSSTVWSRSCTLGPPSVFACSHRAASCGGGLGAQSTVLPHWEAGPTGSPSLSPPWPRAGWSSQQARTKLTAPL